MLHTHVEMKHDNNRLKNQDALQPSCLSNRRFLLLLVLSFCVQRRIQIYREAIACGKKIDGKNVRKKWGKNKKWLSERRLREIAKNKGKSKQITITAKIIRVMRVV